MRLSPRYTITNIQIAIDKNTKHKNRQPCITESDMSEVDTHSVPFSFSNSFCSTGLDSTTKEDFDLLPHRTGVDSELCFPPFLEVVQTVSPWTKHLFSFPLLRQHLPDFRLFGFHFLMILLCKPHEFIQNDPRLLLRNPPHTAGHIKGLKLFVCQIVSQLIQVSGHPV